MCIDIVEIWFGIVNGQISSVFDSYLPATDPYFHFRMITSVNIIGFLPNFVCALILWRSGLGLLMGKFLQFLTELSARDTSVLSFQDDNFTKYQWIFTKLGMCIDIVDICFRIAYGRILSIFDILLSHTIVAGYYGIMLAVHPSVCQSYVPQSIFSVPDDNLSKSQWIFTKLNVCIDIVEIWFGIVNGQISSIFDRVICPRQIHIFFTFRTIT